MKKHANLSIFVPHIGCPCRCIFCDQREISGAQSAPSASDVKSLCERHLGEYGDTEIAFFGGSFTAIDRGYMTELLDAAYGYVARGLCRGIRVSTRPDTINNKILDILRRYGVTTVELGAQSMDDAVLAANRRGHTAADTERASRLIKERGFALGLQMMVGMYKDPDPARSAVETARRLSALSPDCVRIYPTLVLENTELCRLWRQRAYAPLTVDEAVNIVARLLILFDDAGIPVIRTGLHDDESLKSSIVAGPFHSAFGELCHSAVFREKAKVAADAGARLIAVGRGRLSQAIGQKRENLEYFARRGTPVRFTEDETLSGYNIKILQE